MGLIRGENSCLMSDEEGAGGGGGGEKLVPEWTKRAHEYLQRQRYVDPDLIFGNTKTTIVISGKCSVCVGGD